jgi:putative intracellular protease/amidase
VPEIALFLYDDMTALDAVGPYEVLARLPESEVKFVASTPGPKKTDAIERDHDRRRGAHTATKEAAIVLTA